MNKKMQNLRDQGHSIFLVTRRQEELTGQGSEGIILKPFELIVLRLLGPVQPANKVRGREYLRIIYGPEYLLREDLERVPSRAVSTKCSLALCEFAFGIEALEHIVRQEPFRRIHECVFGVLAL